ASPVPAPKSIEPAAITPREEISFATKGRIMRAVAGALGGATLGGALGWFLPPLFFRQPQAFEALGLFFLQVIACGFGAMTGLIVGGSLAAVYWRNRSKDAGDSSVG